MANTESHYFVYMLGDELRSSVKIGMAGDLQKSMHNAGANVKSKSLPDAKLVYYEYFRAEEVALARERQLKENSKDANFYLIESMNPNWLDLSDMLY